MLIGCFSCRRKLRWRCGQALVSGRFDPFDLDPPPPPLKRTRFRSPLLRASLCPDSDRRDADSRRRATDLPQFRTSRRYASGLDLPAADHCAVRSTHILLDGCYSGNPPVVSACGRNSERPTYFVVRSPRPDHYVPITFGRDRSPLDQIWRTPR